MIATLITDRLELRAHREQDFGASRQMWADPDVVRHIGGQPSTSDGAWARILAYHGLWSLLGFGYWAIVERDSQDFVGDVGFADFKRSITPAISGMAEAGWALRTDKAGQGYATEAVNAAVTWFRANRGNRRIVCLIAPENRASIRVAEKCGFTFWREASYKEATSQLWRIAKQTDEE